MPCRAAAVGSKSDITHPVFLGSIGILHYSSIDHLQPDQTRGSGERVVPVPVLANADCRIDGDRQTRLD